MGLPRVEIKAVIVKNGIQCIPIATIDNISIQEISMWHSILGETSPKKEFAIYIKSGTQMVLYDTDPDPDKLKGTFIDLVNILYGKEHVLREDLGKYSFSLKS